MAQPVTMPQLGETVVEGTITKWLKKEGETIGRDEPLFEISTDKVDTEVPSPVAGTVVQIKVQEGETVGVGTELAVIDTDGSGGGAPPSPSEASSTQDTSTQGPSAQDSPAEPAQPVAAPSEPAAPSRTCEVAPAPSTGPTRPRCGHASRIGLRSSGWTARRARCATSTPATRRT